MTSPHKRWTSTAAPCEHRARISACVKSDYAYAGPAARSKMSAKCAGAARGGPRHRAPLLGRAGLKRRLPAHARARVLAPLAVPRGPLAPSAWKLPVAAGSKWPGPGLRRSRPKLTSVGAAIDSNVGLLASSRTAGSDHFRSSKLPEKHLANDRFQSTAAFGERSQEQGHSPKRSPTVLRHGSASDASGTSAVRSAELELPARFQRASLNCQPRITRSRAVLVSCGSL